MSMIRASVAAALGAGVLGGCASSSDVMTGLPSEYRFGEPEVVAEFHDVMPTGVTLSDSGRLFVCVPRWGDDVPATVMEVVDGVGVPYPDETYNRLDLTSPSESLVSVQSVVVGPRGYLWLLDTGSIEFGPTVPGGAKLVAVDLATDEVVRTIPLPREAALETTYLNDVRFDYTRGGDGQWGGLAYITDSSLVGDNAIIVVDLETGDAWRKLDGHESVLPDEDFIGWVEGRPFLSRPGGGEEAEPLRVGADGIALDAGGERLWYTSLSSRQLFSVSLDALADRYRPDAAVARTVMNHGDRGFASDGLESDEQGRLYLTNYEDNAIIVREPDGTYQTLVHDPRFLWPDTLSLGMDRSLYITTNQLHRQAGFQEGVDRRVPPFVVWRVPVLATPVRMD